MRRIAVVGFLCVTVFSAGYPVANAKRCIILTLDTCRADRLTCYGSDTSQTPHLDSLADKGVLFEDAMVSAPLTLPSHCSIFTGLLVSHHHVRDNAWYHLADNIPTLAEQLSEEGVATAAVIAAFPVERRFGLDQGFSFYDDDFCRRGGTGQNETWHDHPYARFERPGEEVTDAALDWLRTEGAKNDSFLLWVHYFDPHSPYEPPPPFDQRFPKHPYNGEVEAMDHAIGRLLDGITEMGLDKNTLFIAVGDHGESLGEHGLNGHGYRLYQVTLQVPMILRLDGVFEPGRRVPEPVQAVDLYPTILDYFGAEPVANIDGVSLWPSLAAGGSVPEQPGYAETIYVERALDKPGKGLVCIRMGDWKLVADRQGNPRALFNVKDEPKELKNRKDGSAAWEAAQGDRMLSLLSKYLEETESQQEPHVTDLDTETLEAMKALGYIR